MLKKTKSKIYSKYSSIFKKDYEKNKLDESFFEFSEIIGEENDPHIGISIRPMGIRFLFIIFLLGIIFLGAYTVYITITQGEKNLIIAQNNAQQTYRITANRGEIISSDGTILATSEIAFNVVVNPSLFESDEEIRSVVSEIKREYPASNYDNIVNLLSIGRKNNLGHVEILSKVNSQDIKSISAIISKYDSISLQETSIRVYPYGEMFAHIIGYVSSVTKEDVIENQDYLLSDQIGKQGIEGSFEQHLKGNDGIFVRYIGARGQSEEELLTQEVNEGASITLTLDFDLQKIAYEELKKAIQATQGVDSGVVLAIDPSNGAVRALVSMPAFDPNKMIGGLTQEETDEYFQSQYTSFFNRATLGAYPSGSIIKPLIGVAALEENIIDPEEIIETTGSITVDSIYDPDISWTFMDWKNHGGVDMRRAIAVSSNVYFYTIGGGYEDIKGLGIRRITEWLDRFNWGEKLNINFDGEATGITPTPEWKEEVKNESWYIGDTYNTSIGQGDILVTPIQIAASIASIVNQGTLYKPFVVEKMEKSNGEGKIYFPDILAQNIASKESLRIIREGMRQTVTEGSSQTLRDAPVNVAGKTGTAQASGSENHALFTGFAPYENPELVFVVLLENGKESLQSVMLTRNIIQRYYK